MRRIVHWITFLAFLGGTAAVIAEVVRTELAEPPPFGRAELAAWLESAGPEAALVDQRRAARQLAQDFHAGYDWQPTLDALQPAAQERFVANFRRLLLLLVEQRADAYLALPPQHRENFLDNELNDFARWYAVAASGRSTGMSLFQQGMLAFNSPELRNEATPKVRNFVNTLQGHVVKRSLGRVLPFGNDRKPRDD